MINICDNFQGWLTQQKKFWKKFKPELDTEKKNINKDSKTQNIFNKFGSGIENALKKSPIYIIHAIENPS